MPAQKTAHANTNQLLSEANHHPKLNVNLGMQTISSTTSTTTKPSWSSKKFSSLEKFKNFNAFLKDELQEFRHAIEDNIDADFHNTNKTKGPLESQTVVIERQGGLANRFVLFLLFLWYTFSAFTLYTNKYIVTSRKADSFIVGTTQMIVTSIAGYIQLRKTLWNKSHPSYQLPSLSNHAKPHYFSPEFAKSMFIIGLLRLFSIVFGLMALKQAAISFVETVKSSSPIFTVIVSRIIIGEITGFWTNISLFPIMLGLTLCSSFEINFSFFGFFAAICTNFTECLQNVFSKLLLCGDHFKFTPLEVQFFSSATSVIILVPLCYFTVDVAQESFGPINLVLFVVNGISFHMQTLLAFTLMSYISPVTYSVCNTLKRAILIWFSVYIFQNQVGYMSAVGTFFVIFGVLFYNHARNIDKSNIKNIKSELRHQI